MKITTSARGVVNLVPHERAKAGREDVSGPTVISLVSPGTELARIYTDNASELPADLGYAAVFKAVNVGEDVEGIRPGDFVMSMGPHASWQCQPADRILVLPPALSAERAVFARMVNVSMSGIVTSSLRPGLTPAVVGLGLVGQLAVRALLAQGYRPIAVDPSEGRRRLAPDSAEVHAVIGADSADVVIECSGAEENVLEALRGVRSGGEVVLCGLAWTKRSEASAFDVLNLAFRKLATVRSGWEWQLPWHARGDIARPDLRSTMRQSLDWLAAGGIDTDGLANTVAPSEAPAAYARLKQRTADHLSFLIDWGGTADD